MAYDFRKVYIDNKDLVWNIVSRYVALKEEKEDLFQEIFLNIYKYLPKFRGESKIETWIYRIAVNRSINYMKKLNRKNVMEKIFNNFKAIENIKDESDRSDDVKNEEKLFKPLEILNEKQRMIFVLAEIEDMNLTDVAEYLKMPVGTVKSNLFRAKNLLREYLEKEGVNNG